MKTHRWYPSGTTSTTGCPPAVGDLVAWDHAVWRVMAVQPVPEDLWTDTDRHNATAYRVRGRNVVEPAVVVVRPVGITSDDVRARDHDKHLRHRMGRCWDIYPNTHYPICAECLEPSPCRAELARREAEQSMQVMQRYVQPGVCPSCQEPITTRQKSRTFDENLELPGGPPVTFHIGRGGCRRSAREYEQRWVTLAPGRRTTLSCPGSVVNHGDGTYECSETVACRGPVASHSVYSCCECVSCRTDGAFGCHPRPDSRLREGRHR